MTRGAEPRWGDGAYPQWIRNELAKRDWQRQDFAQALQKASGGRLGVAGAEALARRAGHGAQITAANRRLIQDVLGEPPTEVIASAAADGVQDKLVIAVRALLNRLESERGQQKEELHSIEKRLGALERSVQRLGQKIEASR